MSDEALRSLERAWEAEPTDQALLSRLLAERRRAGLPLPWRLVRARVHPGFTLARTGPYPMLSVVLADGGLVDVDRGGDLGDEVPAHRHVVLGLPLGGSVDQARACMDRVLDQDGQFGLRWHHATDRDVAAAAPLPGLAYLELTDKDVTDRGLALIAAARDLVELRLVSCAIDGTGLPPLLSSLPHLGALWLEEAPGSSRLSAAAFAEASILASMPPGARIGD